jgi:hypothetical protein
MNKKSKKTMIDDQLAAARFVLASSGKSPRSIGDASRLKIEDWIYKFGYTSSTIGQQLVKRTSGGYLKKLAEQGLLKATKTKSGSPVSFFTLSEMGLQEIESHSNALYKYEEIDPYKVDQQTIRHNLIAQKITLEALQAETIIHYKTERMFMKNGDKLGVKRPDVLWMTKTRDRLAIEIELSAKWDRILDDFISKIISGLKTNKDTSCEYDGFIIYSDSKAILNRYKKAMEPTAYVNSWIKNERNHWVIEKKNKVPEWLIEKVDFQLIER